MAKVHNWQIGREMDYRYDAAYPQRQFAAVFNINRCIACQTCTFACKSTWTFSRGQEEIWWNNVETKPFGGYPRNWDAQLLQIMDESNPGKQTWTAGGQSTAKAPYGRFDGKTIFEMADGQKEVVKGYLPKDDEWSAPNMYEDTATSFPDKGTSLPTHSAWFFYLQRICNHCAYPACLAACPRQAVYKRPEDGIVLLDQERCRGYRKCVSACPYKKTMYRPSTRTSEKCIACYLRVEGTDPLTDNIPTETRCMLACPGKIRLQGLVKVNQDGIWAEDPKNPLYYLVQQEKVALPLYPQFGTQPNVYYIPPRWAPRPYLQQMFGPGVEQAIQAYMNPSRKLLAVLQLFRATRKIVFSFDMVEGPKVEEVRVGNAVREIFNDTVVGFDSQGKEIIRVSVQEPFIERPGYQNSI